METEIDLKREATLQILKGLDYLHRGSNVRGNLKSPKVCQQSKRRLPIKVNRFRRISRSIK